MIDKDKKQDDKSQTDTPMKAIDRIWGDEIGPDAIEIGEIEIEDDDEGEKKKQ